MNKYLFILGLILNSFGSINAQTPATDEALLKACDCFNKKDFGDIAFRQVQLVADSCIKVALYQNLSGVLTEQNASLDDNESMLALAKIMYEYLLKNCLGFQHFSDRIAKKQVEEVKKKNESSIGLLYQLDTDGRFPIFRIITEDNQALDFFWIREFDGSARFFEGIKAYENTIIEIIWADLELFQIKSNKYIYYPEIILLEELETISNKEKKERIKNYKKSQRKKKRKKNAE